MKTNEYKFYRRNDSLVSGEKYILLVEFRK